MASIMISSETIRDRTRDVSSASNDIDTTYEHPEIEGCSEVLDEYCEVLNDLLALLERYRTLVDQDMAMVETLVSEMENADEMISHSFESIPTAANTQRAV